MSTIKSGQAHVAARARLMLLLGEQLITDEIAAVSELVKNSYDADAEEVKVTLLNPSNPDTGSIEVWDNGNGMSNETVLSSWLELGTLSKAKGKDRKCRRSEVKKRIFLGEKGLGRLAVHKLGLMTCLVTRRMGENQETRLTIDWTLFEQEGFLDQVPVKWEVTEPQVFKNTPKGTSITITKLRRKWTSSMMGDLKQNILSLVSPFSKFSDFAIKVEIEDKDEPVIDVPDMPTLIKTATYAFTGEVDPKGLLTYHYRFSRPDLPDLVRDISKTIDVRSQRMHVEQRYPKCGKFSLKIFSWDAMPQDLKAVFGETTLYRLMIRPNSGVKVFRDGFRVYPYGNFEDDWLGLDARKIGTSFELRISRNQVIGAIEISSMSNNQLMDKTDREGLIDNQSYQDFRDLILGAISACEQERYDDRRKMKKALGRNNPEDTDKLIFTRNLAALSKMVSEQTKLTGEVKLRLNNLIDDARNSLENLLSEKEQPLLVAASFGIAFLMPTHEIKRNIDESVKIIGKLQKNTSKEEEENLATVLSHLRQASLLTNGLASLGMKSQNEVFPIIRAARDAVALMKNKFDRNNIKCQIEGSDKIKAIGKENLITVVLLNFLDNSFYWLLRKKIDERQIKVIAGEFGGRPTLIVSDSGPGFEDNDINIVTLPFFTRKPDGMGLGLYIADRIAKLNGGNLRLLSPDDFTGLLPGANIAISLQNAGGKRN
jgi:signal transduction histidine kinase